MALQTSGSISLLDIQNEFGGSNPIGLNEYYGVASSIPASGTIGINVFYGASSSFTYTLSSNTQEGNIRSIVTANGWDGSSAVVFIIASGVYCWSDNVNVAGLSTGGPFPRGLTIINNGKIMGRGGDTSELGAGVFEGIVYAGTAAVVYGNPGGPGLDLSVPVTLDNSNGYIGGGGGSGAGRYAGAGAGGGRCTVSHTISSGSPSDPAVQISINHPAVTSQVPLGGVGDQIDVSYNYMLTNGNTEIYNRDIIINKSGGGGNSGVAMIPEFFI